MSKSAEITFPTLEELLSAGAHFGHKTSAWEPKMRKYIYGDRNGVHIIDLISTMSMLKDALEEIEKASEQGNVLFVGTKGQAASLVEELSKEYGTYYITKRWPGGLFTNFKAIKRSLDKLVKQEEDLATGGKGLVKKEVLLMQREVERLNKLYSGIKFMDRLPTLMVVIDSKLEKNAIKEAKIAGIKVVALLDTNCDPTLVDYPVPANDDSIKSISLFLNLFAHSAGKGSKSAALKTLRKDYEARLQNMKAEYLATLERQRLFEEQEKERIKALKDGAVVSTPVRVVEKAKVVKPVVETVKVPVKKTVKKSETKSDKKAVAKKSTKTSKK